MSALKPNYPGEKVIHELQPFFDNNLASYSATSYARYYGTSVEKARRVLLSYEAENMLSSKSEPYGGHHSIIYSPIINNKFMDHHLMYWSRKVRENETIQNLTEGMPNLAMILHGSVTSGGFAKADFVDLLILGHPNPQPTTFISLNNSPSKVKLQMKSDRELKRPYTIPYTYGK